MLERSLEVLKKNVDDLKNTHKKMLNTMKILSEVSLPDKKGASAKELIYKEDKVELSRFVPMTDEDLTTPTLIVYALVNRYYMMDLYEGKSFVEGLLKNGVDLYVLDWGYPTKDDMFLTLEDYILGYIENAVDHIIKTTGSKKVNILGVCQGGTFSTVYTALRGDKINNLVTLVTPIDFSTSDKLLFKWGKHLNIDSIVDAYGIVPGGFMNNGFLMLQPITLTTTKYVNLIDAIVDEESAANFLTMEKWIFDSPGQAGEAIRQFNNDLYKENKLVKKELVIGRETVDLANITNPVLNVYATNDHQVPNPASAALLDHVSSKVKSNHAIRTGHVGLFVSQRSLDQVVPLVSDFLKKNDK